MFAQFKNELVFDALQTMYPSRLRCLASGEFQLDDVTRQYYGFVLSGEVEVTRAGLRATLGPSMYFSFNADCGLRVKGELVLIERLGYRGLNEIGGPVEKEGRLAYIDTCRSTVLVSPARRGDPVFNYLQFPPHVLQSMHFHPTVRLGVVFEGHGFCHTTDSKIELSPGTVFFLPENQLHCFESKAQGLRIIAYHPDSDTGPTDENHPMLNRTYLSGDVDKG